LIQILRYKFDNFISKGGTSIFISLAVSFIASLAVIGGIRAVFFLYFPEEADAFQTIVRNIYITFLQLTDPGNMAQDITTSALYKFTAVLAGLSGVVLFSMLIAVITTALDQKLAELKQGHSQVLETGHTLILGWNERVVEIIRELMIANESEKSPAVVILSETEKEFMDETLKSRIPNPGNMRIITRSGNTSLLSNLARVSASSCKSIIVLAGCSDSASAEDKSASDAKVIKTVLAVFASKDDTIEHNIVSEIFEEKNRSIVEQISPEEIKAVDTEDILAKILVQTSRTSGLAVVYNEILSFNDSEMYFYQADWRGIEFWQLQYFFQDGIPMGIRKNSGEITINPDLKTKMEAEDEILILANDDSKIKFLKKPVLKPEKYPLKKGKLEPKHEKNLILGWNRKALIFIQQLSDYVRDDSSVDIVVNKPSQDIILQIENLKQELSGKLTVNLINSNPLSREVLESLNPFSHDNIVILSQSGETSSAEKTDSETIIILLLLRSIFQSHPDQSSRTKLITEVMDSDNQELISKAGVNDFIISNRFVSNMLAQISEESGVKTVYDTLFQEEGSEIYLKPASLYFENLPLKIRFGDLLAMANKRGEICIGIREAVHAGNINKNFGVKLVPDKNTLYNLNENDSLVVIAEDEL